MAFQSFLPRFDETFAPMLVGGIEKVPTQNGELSLPRERAEGFRIIFAQLEDRLQRRPEPLLLVETGSVRDPNNFKGDGCSTLLFDAFLQHHGGTLFTVDLDPACGAIVREHCSNRVHFVCSDSVRFLHDWVSIRPGKAPDLLYLDSYDLDVKDPLPSSVHHLKELTASAPILRADTIIAVDDNFQLPDRVIGKGALVGEFMRAIGALQLHAGYHWIWSLRERYPR